LKVLGIETATLVCGAAVVVDRRVVADHWIEEKNIHAERLVSLIGEAMEQAGLANADLDGIAVSAGPGSFTGLRIGVSVAKGLAYAIERPLVAIPTLIALAERIVRDSDPPYSGYVLPVLRARRDEIYCQLLEASDGTLRSLWPPRDATLGQLPGLVEDHDVLVTGEGANKLGIGLWFPPEAGKSVRVADPELARCSAGIIALLGVEALERGEVADLAEIEPQYIKEFYFRTRQP
jgi:tRNA threonylcarbamoyladenosine biosynthesis protein TsaB